MKLLLDTHTFLWLAQDNPQLSRAARAAIADPQNELFLSVASIWELAIKIGNGKLILGEDLSPLLDRWLDQAQIQLLPIEKSHATLVATLPMHHRDPFDRLLIAQAVSEHITLVSGDTQIAAYEVPIIW
jgi:PIN domain nuclease of toxin-antitoxin system